MVTNRKQLIDTGARIRIVENSPMEVQIIIDDISVELTFRDLERLQKAIGEALEQRRAQDPR